MLEGEINVALRYLPKNNDHGVLTLTTGTIYQSINNDHEVLTLSQRTINQLTMIMVY